MKIELINENQIKCTLTRSDLAFHQIKLSELAYGTEKTKDLFQDMMDQAFNEFGFEASDALVIEAIPVSMDCIILMITRVEEPEDLDQGFSGLSSVGDLVFSDNDDNDPADELDDLIDSLSDEHFLENGMDEAPAPARKPVIRTVPAGSVRASSGPAEMCFSFEDLNSVIEFAHKAGGSFKGESTLYRSPDNGRYYILLVNTTRSAVLFGHICNLALEYGSKEPTGFARGAFMGEHYEVLVPKGALQKLAYV